MHEGHWRIEHFVSNLDLKDACALLHLSGAALSCMLQFRPQTEFAVNCLILKAQAACMTSPPTTLYVMHWGTGILWPYCSLVMARLPA